MKRFLPRIKNLPFKFLFLIAVVLVIRVILFSEPSFKIDMGDWQAWTAKLVGTGPLKFYTPGFFADYLPFFYIFLWIMGEIFSLIFGKAAIFSNYFAIYIKIISNIFDLLTAYTIFLIVKRYVKQWAMAGVFLYLINPSVIFNSSVWGQLDAIPTFFFVWAIYRLEEHGNLKQWSIFNTLSFMIKPYNAPALPIMLMRLIKKFTVKRIFFALFFSAIIFFALIIPFFPQNPFFGVFNHLINSLNVYPYASINAYNFWGIFGWWKPDNLLWLGLSYHVWGYIIFAVTLCLILLPYIINSKNATEKTDYFAYTLSSLAFFLFLTRIHERYLFPVFALLLVIAIIYKSKILFANYIILSVVNFINIFYSYYYYNYAYSNPVFSNNTLFMIAGNFRIFFSALSVLIFGVMLVFYLRQQFYGRSVTEVKKKLPDLKK